MPSGWGQLTCWNRAATWSHFTQPSPCPYFTLVSEQLIQWCQPASAAWSIELISEDTGPPRKAGNPSMERNEPSGLVALLIKHLCGSKETSEPATFITSSWEKPVHSWSKDCLLARGDADMIFHEATAQFATVSFYETGVAFFTRKGFLCRGLIKHVFSLTHSESFCLMFNPTELLGEDGNRDRKQPRWRSRAIWSGRSNYISVKKKIANRCNGACFQSLF